MRKSYKAFKIGTQVFSEYTENYKLLNATLSNDFYADQVRGSRTIIEEQIPGRDIPYFYEVDDKPLEFEVTFASVEPMSKVQIKNIVRTLVSSKNYQELTFGEYENYNYVAKTPTYKVVFTGNLDINYVQQSANVNYFQVQSSSTVEAPKENALVYTLNYVKTEATTQTYIKTGGTILNGENTITGITNFINLRIGQTVIFNSTTLGTITNINLEDEEITISANSASTRTGSFTFRDDKRLSFANIANLSVGMLVVGTGVPLNTFIDEIYDVANNVVSLDKNLTTVYNGSGSITFYDLNKLVIDNLDNIKINQYIFSGSSIINDKKIIAIDGLNNILTLDSQPTTFIGSLESPAAVVIAGPTYIGSKTLNFTAGTYYYLLKNNIVYCVDPLDSSKYFYGKITEVTTTSITVEINSAQGYKDIIEPNIYVKYIDSNNGFLSYFTLRARADRPYGFNKINFGSLETAAASSFAIASTGDVEFFPDIRIVFTTTTSNWIRIRNTQNLSTLTFKGISNTEDIIFNANLKTISSNFINIYTRWNKDYLYLSPNLNTIVIEQSSDNGASWSTYSAGLKLLVTGEAPVYVYETE
jgi:hypothetical protein